MTLIETLAAKPPPVAMDSDGVMRVGGTRVTLDTIVGMYEDGATAEEIALAYPSLGLAEVHAAISYYLSYAAEVRAHLQAAEEESKRVRAENERRFPPEGVRARLLARRRKTLNVQ